jgi:hypothetical protein
MCSRRRQIDVFPFRRLEFVFFKDVYFLDDCCIYFDWITVTKYCEMGKYNFSSL